MKKENAIAPSTIEQIIASTTNHSLRLRASQNRDLLRGEIRGDTAMHEQVQFSPSSHHRSKKPGDNARRIAALVEGIASTEDEDTKIRRACRLAEADLGNTIAFGTLLQILTSAESESIKQTCRR